MKRHRRKVRERGAREGGGHALGEEGRERYHKLLEHLIIVAAGEHKLAGIELEEANAYRPACVLRQHTSAYV